MDDGEASLDSDSQLLRAALGSGVYILQRIGNSDEILVQIDPINSELDDHIIRLHQKIRKLKVREKNNTSLNHKLIQSLFEAANMIDGMLIKTPDLNSKLISRHKRCITSQEERDLMMVMNFHVVKEGYDLKHTCYFGGELLLCVVMTDARKMLKLAIVGISICKWIGISKETY